MGIWILAVNTTGYAHCTVTFSLAFLLGVHCQSLTADRHLEMSTEATAVYTTAVVWCSFGYHFEFGATSCYSAECATDGEWQSEPPVCKGRC